MARLAIVPIGPEAVSRLAEILAETVAAGGSVHFMHPTPMDQARTYWTKAFAGAAEGDRIVLGGFVDERLEGTVSLYLDTPPNQPFRAEIWKLMVAPSARRTGLARRLMTTAESLAAEHGRTLLNLDTVTDGPAAKLYESLGWTLSGTIPDYAYTPHGGLTGTSIYYKRLGPTPPAPDGVTAPPAPGRSQAAR